VTLTRDVTVVQEVEKLTAKVLRVVFSEEIVKLTEPLAEIGCVAGVILKFMGTEVEIVPAVLDDTTIVPVVPPFFLMESDEGLTVNLQPPEPLPVTGGPGVPLATVSQSKALLWAVVPVTTAVEATPAVVLTVA